MHVTAKFVKLVVLSVLTALSASCGEFTTTMSSTRVKPF